MLNKAINIVSNKFIKKYDKGGHPYILHCIRVMQNTQSKNIDVLCAAMLHDTIEDTDYTYEQLIADGFSLYTIELLKLVTHNIHDSYDDYIKKISTNKDAVLIKLADLKDNMDPTRLKGLRKKDFDRMEKYQRSWIYLQGIL